MMEFKIQVLIGDAWTDTKWSHNMTHYPSVKLNTDHLRRMNEYCKYRIVGRKILPWCEIKENEVK